MAFSFRKISKKFFIALNVLVAVAFCVTCLQPWQKADTFWFLGFFTLAFPYLFIILIVFIFFWLAAKVQYTLISLVAMAIAWKQIDVMFNVKQSNFAEAKAAGSLRVMSWNVRSFRSEEPSVAAQRRNADKMKRLIDEMKPDLICMQEFAQYDSPKTKRNFVKMLNDQGYEHYLLSRDYIGVKNGYSIGVAIFSRYPLINKQKKPFNIGAESIIYADMVWGKDTIRVFTTHLQSFKFSGSDYRDIEKIKNNDDSLYEASLNIYAKMKRAFKARASQADMLHPLLDNSPYPEILACDMNDVPASYTYWQLRGNRFDAFAEKGFGVGRTFIALAPTLRIDYIMPDKRFAVQQFNIIQKRYSDHLAIVADLQLRDSVPD